jgi:hypothetical protein
MTSPAEAGTAISSIVAKVAASVRLTSLIRFSNVKPEDELRSTASPPTILPGVRRLLLPLLFLALALASCGGGDARNDVEGLVDTAFSQEMQSADLKFEAEVQLEGSQMFDRPLRIQAAGPFRTNRGKLPSVDLEVELGTDGGGQTVTTGFLSTGDRAFVKFQDIYYEEPASEVRRANRAFARNQRRHSSLRALGLDPRSWLLLAEDKGDEQVAGVPTRHLSGTLDVTTLLSDLNRFVRRSGSTLGGATGHSPPEPLSREDILGISEVVEDPSLDVYVGKRDRIVRRVSGRIEFNVPGERREEFGGLEGGKIQFSVEFRDVNGDQEIDAPREARPLEKLTRSLGGLDALIDLAGGGDAPTDGGDLGTSEPDVTPPSGETGTETSPDDSGTEPEEEAFREYADCLDDARPGDTEALQNCAELLQQP